MLKLYYHLMSQPSRACYIFVTKFGIPFEKKVVDLQAGELRYASYNYASPLV